MTDEQKSGERYFKILRSDLCHNGFTYKEGLNDDSANYKPNERCNNGLFFARAKDLHNYFGFGNLVCDVTLPEGAQVTHFSNKSKANKIIVSNIQPLESSPLWSDREFCQGVIRNLTEVKYKRLVKNAEALVEMVKIDGFHLQFIDEKLQTEDIAMAAVSKNGRALKYVSIKTKSVIEKAVDDSPQALEFVDAVDQTEGLVMKAINRCGLSLGFVKIPRTAEMIRAAIEQDGNSLQFVDAADQTVKLCVSATRHPFSLAVRFVKIQSAEVYKEIVKGNGECIAYVPDEYLTPELCILAHLQKDGTYLQFVCNPTDEMCEVAVKSQASAIRFVKPEQQTEQLCVRAVRYDGSNLEHVHNKTDAIISLALQNNKYAVQYVPKFKLNDRKSFVPDRKPFFDDTSLNRQLLTGVGVLTVILVMVGLVRPRQ